MATLLRKIDLSSHHLTLPDIFAGSERKWHNEALTNGCRCSPSLSLPLLMYAWSPTSRTAFWAMFASLVGAKVTGPGYFIVYVDDILAMAETMRVAAARKPSNNGGK